MSGLVLNESAINPADIKTKKITIDRINLLNSGVRIWFVILSKEGKYYQRWSLLMNPTDEKLLLAQPGDELTICYIDDYVEDPQHQQFKSFDRSVILEII